MTARWGIYDQGAIWDPVPMEAAYGHQFDLFTHESKLGDSSTWRGTGITKVPGMALARNAICSIGINAYVLVSGVKFPVPSTSGLYNPGFDAVAHGEYDSSITAWINVLLAYKAEGGQVHALFHLEPSLDNPGQPAAGTSTEYKAAFAHIYPMFNAAGIELGWDSTSSDWRNGIATDWEPANYDISSADFYPLTGVEKTMEWGLGAFFDYNTANHPTHPILVRSTTCKEGFTDDQAAAWFTDASATLLAVPNLLGVGWDTDNQGIHDPSSGANPLVKAAFAAAATNWATSFSTSVEDDFERVQPLVNYLIEAHGSTMSVVGGPAAPVSDDFGREQPLVSYLIEAHGSTLELEATTGHVGVWDDPLVRWDDPNYTWDGTAVVLPPGPAFAGLAFQADAFPVSAFISLEASSTLPSLSQDAVGRSSNGIVQIFQTLAALTQSATVDVTVEALTDSVLPAPTQTSTENSTVYAHIGDPQAPWQDDAFQPNAFRVVASHGQILPALTQSAHAFKLGAGEGIAASVLPALKTDADVDLSISAVIDSALPAFAQGAEVSLNPIGTITSTLPAFTQAMACAVQIAPDLAGINQTLPALTQSFKVVLAIWAEWDVTSGTEWHVRERV